MILNEYFDKIYCINLDRRPDRWEECLKLFKSLKMKVERHSAVDGKKFKSIFGATYDARLACSISHSEIIFKSLKNGLKNVLILEDDIVFSENFNTSITSILNDIPIDWDMIYFGANHRKPKKHIINNIYKLSGCVALHCYAINGKSMNELYDHIMKNIELATPLNKKIIPIAVDVLFMQLHENLNVYGICPSIAWQMESFSDIEQSNKFYKCLLPKI